MGSKCKEKNLCMAISEDVDFFVVEEIPQVDDPTLPSDPPEVEPLISLNTLIDFFTPHTLKLIGYIKHWKVIILANSGSTHSFIHRHIS
jgi:hypothetical protein